MQGFGPELIIYLVDYRLLEPWNFVSLPEHFRHAGDHLPNTDLLLSVHHDDFNFHYQIVTQEISVFVIPESGLLLRALLRRGIIVDALSVFGVAIRSSLKVDVKIVFGSLLRAVLYFPI